MQLARELPLLLVLGGLQSGGLQAVPSMLGYAGPDRPHLRPHVQGTRFEVRISTCIRRKSARALFSPVGLRERAREYGAEAVAGGARRGLGGRRPTQCTPLGLCGRCRRVKCRFSAPGEGRLTMRRLLLVYLSPSASIPSLQSLSCLLRERADRRAAAVGTSRSRLRRSFGKFSGTQTGAKWTFP